MIHRESPIPATNRLPCSVSVGLPLPWEALWLQSGVRCSVAEERGRRRKGRWLAAVVLVAGEGEAGWSSGLSVAMRSVLFGPSPEPSSMAARCQLLYGVDVLLSWPTYNIVIVRLQSRGIGHRTFHDPSLRLVLCADEVLNLRLGRHMARRQFRLPVLVRSRIAPFQHALELLVGPGVEVD